MKYIKTVIISISAIVGICIVSFFVWALWFVANFHGDRYKDAEPYVILAESNKMTLQESIDFLYEFQSNNSKYQLITTNEKGEICHNFGHDVPNRSNLYRVYFYFKDIDITISCNVSILTRNNTSIELYAISEGVNFANWERINNYKEISHEENSMIKKKFETEILDHLGVKWRYKRWWD